MSAKIARKTNLFCFLLANEHVRVYTYHVVRRLLHNNIVLYEKRKINCRQYQTTQFEDTGEHILNPMKGFYREEMTSSDPNIFIPLEVRINYYIDIII